MPATANVPPGAANPQRTKVVEKWLWWIVAWLLLALAPKAPESIGAGMDASWNYALNMIHSLGHRFGPDIIFTMGPLGFLSTPDPEWASLSWVVMLRLYGWLMLSWGVIRIGLLRGPAVALIAVVCLLPQSLMYFHYPDAWQAVGAALMAAVAFGACRSLLDLALAGIFAGLSLLFKLNEGLVATAVFLVLAAYAFRALPRRRGALFAVALIPWAVLFGGFWILQGHPLDALAYARNGLQIIAGYNWSVTAIGPAWQSGLAAIYFVLIGLTPLLARSWSYLAQASLLPALLLAFAAFKHGIVRQDGHALLMMSKMAAGAVFLLVAAQSRRWLCWAALLSLFGGLVPWYFHATTIPTRFEAAWQSLKPSGLVSGMRRLANPVAWWDDLREENAKALQVLKLPGEFHLRLAERAVDAFPENLDVIRANGWRYRPRPTIQSSASYTRHLDEWNAQHLASKKSADSALFIWHAIDARHVFLQDPATFMALLDNFELALEGEKALLLERRAKPVNRPMVELGTHLMRWDTNLSLPSTADDEILMARFQIQPSLPGRLWWFLFRASPVSIIVSDQAGRQLYYTIVPDNLNSPAILSPLPRSLDRFANLLRGGSPSKDELIHTLAWYTPHPDEYQQEIRVTLYRSKLNP
jgi:hypothetical protein